MNQNTSCTKDQNSISVDDWVHGTLYNEKLLLTIELKQTSIVRTKNSIIAGLIYKSEPSPNNSLLLVIKENTYGNVS